MDFLTAKHLYEHMYPKPLEIICYHCQQAIEKMLKGVLISRGVMIKKTHDLGLLAEMLQEYTEVFLVPFKVPKGIFKWHFE